MTDAPLIATVAELLGKNRAPEPLRPEHSLSDLGVTSFELLRVIVALSKRRGTRIAPERFRGVTTVADLCALFEAPAS